MARVELSTNYPSPTFRPTLPRMNRLLILPALLLTLLVGNPAFSADFQKGATAYESGDYATALREWKPLAEQGNASAQFNLKTLKTELVGKHINDCLYDEIDNIRDANTRQIVTIKCHKRLNKRSLDWLIRNLD